MHAIGAEPHELQEQCLAPRRGERKLLCLAQDLGAGLSLNTLLLWVAGLAFVAFACPNSHELLNRAEPALGWQASRRQHHWMGAIEWRRSLAWLVVVSLIAAAGVVNLGGQSEFLYWQF